MKKILITGANSFVGKSFEEYLTSSFYNSYVVDTIDMVGNEWRSKQFGDYDVVFHVAGIAHSDVKKISEELISKYYSVNRDLTIEVATKAKQEGVGQFIFMSSSIVYGDSAPIGKDKHITKNTPEAPVNSYGDSKYQAEQGLQKLDSNSFRVVILRPPMIYGKGSKGNYPVLSRLAKRLVLFPKVNNCRSMLYIGNLVEFVRLMIDNQERGVFWPQNDEYSNTSDMVKTIAKVNGHRIILLPGFSWLLKVLSHFSPLINKAFGNMTYDQSLSKYKCSYRKYSLLDSIVFTESREENG